MNAPLDEVPARGRRLESIFDDVPPGTLLSLDDLELLMQNDTQRRIIAVLDRVIPQAHDEQPPGTTTPT
jgi:hypothetical protein